MMTPFWLSLEIAFWALFVVAISGLLLNYGMFSFSFSGKTLIDSIVTLPLVLPPVVIGFALLVVFSPAYPFGAWLEMLGVQVVFSRLGAVLAAAIVAFPLFYRTLRGALAEIPQEMLEVARTLGASETKIFFTIAMPLAWRGILTGLILAFSRALGEFGATILIAGNIPSLTRTLPLAIYSSVEQGAYDEAVQYVFIICALSLSLLCGVQLLLENRKKKGGL